MKVQFKHLNLEKLINVGTSIKSWLQLKCWFKVEKLTKSWSQNVDLKWKSWLKVDSIWLKVY